MTYHLSNMELSLKDLVDIGEDKNHTDAYHCVITLGLGEVAD